jgi:hypothetical protein
MPSCVVPSLISIRAHGMRCYHGLRPRLWLAFAVGSHRHRQCAPRGETGSAYVTEAAVGSGAVREVVELILKAQGLWEEILQKYEITSAPAHRIGFSR